MRIVIAALLCSIVAATSPPTVLAAGEPLELAHNPFSRPSSETENYDLRIVEDNDGSGPVLALRATMVGPSSRLANVAGRVLKPGDEIEGYRLVEIHEDYAVFKRDGKLLTVYVKPQVTEDDE